MQAPDTQSEALGHLISLRKKLDSELKCNISHSTFMELPVIHTGQTFRCACILQYFNYDHTVLWSITKHPLRRSNLAENSV